MLEEWKIKSVNSRAFNASWDISINLEQFPMYYMYNLIIPYLPNYVNLLKSPGICAIIIM